jgi:hypothetical protein
MYMEKEFDRRSWFTALVMRPQFEVRRVPGPVCGGTEPPTTPARACGCTTESVGPAAPRATIRAVPT